MVQEEDNDNDLGIYGLCNVRTHRDYEIYAGINFTERRLHENTLRGVDPPVNDETDWHLRQKEKFEYVFEIPMAEDFSFIYIGVEDKDGVVIHRQDITTYQEKINVTIESYDKPHKWVYWVHHKDGEWGQRIDTLL